MGITASSCISSHTATIKLINGEGRTECYAHPVRAAEIMAEHPGQFVCDQDHLNVGYRIPGVAADEELELRRIYFLLPMDMLYSVLTEEEMAAVSRRAAAGAAADKIKGRSTSERARRILPVCGDFCLAPVGAGEVTAVVDEPPTGKAIGVQSKRSSSKQQRSWRPSLDTIEEVS